MESKDLTVETDGKLTHEVFRRKHLHPGGIKTKGHDFYCMSRGVQTEA